MTRTLKTADDVRRQIELDLTHIRLGLEPGLNAEISGPALTTLDPDAIRIAPIDLRIDIRGSSANDNGSGTTTRRIVTDSGELSIDVRQYGQRAQYAELTL